MIDALAKTLGLHENQLFQAIRDAAGSGELVYSIANEGFSRPNAAETMMVWRPSGWSVAIICGPRDQVAGLVPNPWQETADYNRGWNDCLKAIRIAGEVLEEKGVA